jgi:type I restriction enzyme S subunit
MAAWQQTRLGNISQIYSGFAFRSQDLGEKGIPVVKIANIQNKRVSPECADHLPVELCTEKLNRYFLQPDDTLIAMTGAGSVGKVGKMPRAEGRFLVNQRVGIVRPDSSLCDPAFVYFALSQDFYETKLYGLGLGAGQPNVSAKQIGELEIPFPPLAVQQRIAGILSAYDELMENSQRRIRLLEAMARALYREWFVHFRFPGHEKHPRVASSLGDIPQGWEMKSIQQFGAVITGKTPSKANTDFYGNDVPFVKTPDMHGNMFILGTSDCLSTAGAESQANKTIPAGSICVSCIGTIGVVSITTENCQTNQQINSVVLVKTASREFLFLRLQDAKRTLENLGANGATMGNVNKGKFEAMEIVCPPDDLLARYHRLVEPMFSEILSLFRQIQNLRRTRDVLLPRLLSGQVALNGKET